MGDDDSKLKLFGDNRKYANDLDNAVLGLHKGDVDHKIDAEKREKNDSAEAARIAKNEKFDKEMAERKVMEEEEAKRKAKQIAANNSAFDEGKVQEEAAKQDAGKPAAAQITSEAPEKKRVSPEKLDDSAKVQIESEISMVGQKLKSMMKSIF